MTSQLKVLGYTPSGFLNKVLKLSKSDVSDYNCLQKGLYSCIIQTESKFLNI